MEYYTVKRMDRAQVHTTKWMTFPNIMLEETSQIQKSMYCRIPLTECTKPGKIDL